MICGITLPDPFSAEELCAQLAVERGRPLHLAELPTPTVPGTPSGMWLMADRGDFIFYDGQTSPLHQEHIIVHEIGHMVCEHEPPPGGRLYQPPGFDVTDATKPALPRLRYSDEQEQEAELIASLILEAAGRVPEPIVLSGMLGGLESAMGLRGIRYAGAPCSPG